MQPLLTCTTEELVCLLSMCGYHEMAKGLGESMLGEKTPEAWDAVIEGAAHQMMLKGIWDTEKAERDEIPLGDEWQRFTEQYAESSYLVRFVDRVKGQSLLFHQISDDQWFYHHVINDVIHIFAKMESKKAYNEVDRFFDIAASAKTVRQEFVLTPEQFDRLTDDEQVSPIQTELSAVAEPPSISAFEDFIKDLAEQNWTLKNGSAFQIGDQQNDMTISDLFFFLPAQNGIWLVVYEVENGKQQVRLTKTSKQEWLKTNEVLFRNKVSTR
ncbi:hypothetical protein J26TS2_25680 [Shouchella clausii]|nr:hypothetical protein J26TS2_25680 [Shouchella clausii]